MALKLKGSTSGFVGLDAPSVAGNNTLILPENSGSAFQVFANDITAGVTTFTQVTVSRNGDLTVPGTISIGGTLTYEDVTSVDSVGIVTARGLSIFGNTTGLSVTGVGTFAGDVSIADKIIHTGDTDTSIRFPSANTVSIETAGSERLKVDSSGQLLIGTNITGRAIANVTSIQQIETTDGSAALSITRNDDAANASTARLSFGRSRSNSVGGATSVTTNDLLGEIRFSGADGTDLTNHAASIAAVVDGSVSSNTVPGRITFNTASGSDPVERMRITSAGKVGINAVSPASRLDVRDTSTTSYPFTSADSGVYSYSPYSHELNIRNNTTGTTDGFAGIHFHAGERSTGGRQGTARISALYTGEYKADLVFATRNVSFKERLRVTSAGKVGIGTDLPQEELTIMSSTPAFMLRDSDQPNSYTQVSNANQDMYFSANGASAHANFIFRSGNNGSFEERLRINSAGSMGLGTGANIDERVHFENNGNISLLVECSASGSGANSAIRLKSADSSSDWYMQTGNVISGGLRFYSGSERVRIGTTGVVHINSVGGGQAIVAFGDPSGNSFQDQNRIGGDTILVADASVSSAISLPRQGVIAVITGFSEASDTTGLYPQPGISGIAYIDCGPSRNIKIADLGTFGTTLVAKSAYDATVANSDNSKVTVMAGSTQGTFHLVNRMGDAHRFQITFL